MEDWYGPDAATFGDRLAAARDASGMTQETMARRLGVKLKTIHAWENDVSEPRANKLSMIAGMLNVSITWLLNGQGDGVEAPDAQELDEDVLSVIDELRKMRVQALKQVEKLGRLEKRLRQTQSQS